MSLGRVVVGDSVDLLRPGICRLREHDVEVVQLSGGDPTAKIAAARDADVILVGVEALTAEQIDQIAGASRLRLAIRLGVGYDLIDVEAASRHGIRVANVPDYCTDEVADHTLTLLLALARRLPHFLEVWRTRGWLGSDDPPVPRLADLTLGLVGAGRIGRAVAARARSFGMQVVAADPVPPPDIPTLPLHDVLGTADAISVHCPYSAATHHLLDDAAFQAMRPGGILINTARGPIVDSEALLRGLEREQPALAALDVVEGEPRPDLNGPLFSHPRVLVTPHVAYYSTRSKHDLSLFAADNVLGFLNGQPAKHVVNPG